MPDILNTDVFVREYNDHSPLLLGYLTRVLNGNKNEAYDLTQETFLRAWKARKGFQGKSSVKSWFFTIGINIFREKLRKKKIVNFVPEVPEMGTADEPEAGEKTSQTVIRKRVREELSRLPENQQEVFNLIRNKGYSYKETAEALDISVATVRMRLHRANQALAAGLQDLKEVIS